MASNTQLDDKTIENVVNQVEYYFSAENFMKDSRLLRSIVSSEDQMMSLAMICSLRKMRNYLALGTITADEVPEDMVQAVADCLRSSSFLKISDDGKKVGTKTPLAKIEELIELIDSRVVAASPLPLNVKSVDMISLFTQFGIVKGVQLPKDVSNRKKFCGTALIEFSSKEDAEKLLTKSKSLAYGEVVLELKSKKDFEAEREKQTKEWEKNQQQRKRKRSEEAVYPESLIVNFKLLKRSTFVKEVAEGKGSEKEGEKKATEGKSMDVVHHEDLLAVFEKVFIVKYMDFERGAESGYIEYEDSEASRKALGDAALNKDCLVVKNYVVILEPDFGSLPDQPRAQERDTGHFLWPRRKYNEIKRMENYPTTLPILPLLQIEKYRNPLYLQDTKCIVPIDEIFAIRWCIPEFHLLFKGKTNPTNHLNPLELKLHFMILYLGNPISADPDASLPPLKFINSKTQYLNGILDKEYPCLDNWRRNAAYRGTSFDSHLSKQNILDQEHALELMLCCHETFQMSRLIYDLRNRAPEFAIRENCPCYPTPPGDPGMLQMRAEDLCTLVRDLLGPNFSPTIHTKLVGEKLVFHEITLYVNKEGQPAVMDVACCNCGRADLVNF